MELAEGYSLLNLDVHLHVHTVARLPRLLCPVTKYIGDIKAGPWLGDTALELPNGFAEHLLVWVAF